MYISLWRGACESPQYTSTFSEPKLEMAYLPRLTGMVVVLRECNQHDGGEEPAVELQVCD